MEKISNKNARRAKGLGLLGIAIIGLTACSPNFSGEGNEFVVRGVVTDPGEQSLKAAIYQVNSAQGDAEGWFDDKGEHQIHDNCDCSIDFLGGNEKIGRTFDLRGNEVSPSSIAIGACVQFAGSIRDNREGKTTPQRPVYETAHQIVCGQEG